MKVETSLIISLVALLLGLFFAGVISPPCYAQFDPNTVLATSTAGNVTFEEIEENWPYFGSDVEKLDLVRKALKEKIYAKEALQEKFDERKEIQLELEDAQLSALLEALFVKEFGETQVTENDVNEYYNSKKDLYYLDEHFFLRHIPIEIKDPSLSSSRLQAKTKAIEALARLKTGEDFEKVAREFSTDPEYTGQRLGPIPAKDLPKEWKDQILYLEPGQFSDVIEMDNAMLVVEVLEHNQAGYQSLDSVRLSIRAKLEKEKRRDTKESFIVSLIGSVPLKEIDHQAIEDPETKENTVVLKSQDFKMTKGEYLRWAQQQNPTIQKALRDPMNREALIRKQILLKPWVEKLGKKDKLENSPVFEKTYDQLRRTILAKYFEDSLYQRNPSFLEVTPEEIQEYYATHLEDYQIPKKAEIRDIVIKAETDLGQSTQSRLLAFRYAEQVAKEAIQKIKEGKTTFAMMALQHDSSLDPGGYFEVGQETQGELFDEVVFQLQPGQIAPEPLLTEEGYRIVQLNKIIPAVQLPLSHVQGRIEGLLKQDKADRLRQRLENTYFQKANAVLLEKVILGSS